MAGKFFRLFSVWDLKATRALVVVGSVVRICVQRTISYPCVGDRGWEKSGPIVRCTPVP